MAEKTGNAFSSFINSGKNLNPEDSIRYIILNFAVVVGGILLLVFGISVFLEGNTARGISDWGMAVLCIITIFLLRTKLSIQIPGGVVLGGFGIMCALFVATGELRGFASLWIFAFPLLTIFIMGLQIGLIFSIMLLCAVVLFTIVPGMAGILYSVDSASRLIGVYVLTAFLTVLYEQTRLMKERRVNQLTQELRVERDTITAMKDNLKTGLFLMDKNYTIQGSYSKPLESILGTDEIAGKKLTGFLAASLKAKERDTLEDYFNMVLNRQFEASMLEEINPISEFTYVDEISKEQKILRTAFSSVDQGMGNYYILGSMEDVSAARELERQLEAEAGKREEEMRALFQVIQVDPAVFGDFIEDTEYEFNHINAILQNTGISAKDAMVSIYQSVHAIKSNALILGLDNFSAKLHELENTIKQYRDSDEVSFENVLHITVELERIMKEKDKFRDTIAKIEAFRSTTGNNRRQDRYVLTETLSKACEKAAAAQEKKAAFTVEEMDGSILEHGPRRIIKEVLTQLVRNSVSHGIEHPDERRAKGKDPTGTIRLGITKENGLIHLRLSDDGRGLDFVKIREKALALKLLSTEEAENKNQLLQVIFSPGFSTAEIADLNAGRGIGLNLVRERIKDLHGSIKLSCEAGKGTTFHLFIPMEEAAAESKAS